MIGPRTRGLWAGVLLTLALAGCGGSDPAGVPDPPAEGNVLDAAGVLTDQEEADLSAQIDRANSGTDAARVAVLTIDGAGGDLESFARQVASSWGVGDEGADNGVLILADTGERELRIETADGVRERFSDDDAEQIIEDVLEPAFADEEYATGLRDAVEQVYLYAEGGEPEQEPFDWGLLAGVLGAVAAVIGALLWWIMANHRKRRRAADEELRAAEEADPDLHLTDDQREAYRKYRYNAWGKDQVSNPAVWLPLYIANPALYSGSSAGGSSDGSSGSSFTGGGGFSGGGASGSY